MQAINGQIFIQFSSIAECKETKPRIQKLLNIWVEMQNSLEKKMKCYRN